jgi:hypothetical protein
MTKSKRVREDKSVPGPSEDEVLYQFAVAKEAPDAELLQEFVRRYPKHAAALRQAAVDLALDRAIDDAEAQSQEPVAASAEGVAKALRRFEEQRARIAAEASAQAGVDNPFLALDAAGMRRVVKQLDVSTPFLAKLRDREVLPETIPERVRRWVADVLEAPVDVLMAHLSAPRQAPAGAFWKADQRPEVRPQQTFEEAVRTSGLTPEQQRRLLEP